MATSYTAATGKRPLSDRPEIPDDDFAWFPYEYSGDGPEGWVAPPEDLPLPIYQRLAGGMPETVGAAELYRDYPTESAALAAADAAYERAVAEGAMGPIELASRPDAG